MTYKLFFSKQAESDLQLLMRKSDLKKRLKAVRKTLGLLEANPRHPGLQTHKFTSLCGPKEEDVFEAYAENNTPGAYRIFWYYGPARSQITVIAITPHP